MTDEEIQALIDHFDEDGDGEMQYDEFVKLWMNTGIDAPVDYAASPAAVADYKGVIAVAGADASGAAGASRIVDGGGTPSVTLSGMAVASASFKRRGSVLARSMSKGVVAMGKALAQMPSKADELAALQSAVELHALALEQQARAAEMRDKVYDHESDDLAFEARLGFAMVNHPRAVAALEAKGKAKLSFDELARIFGKDTDGRSGVRAGATPRMSQAPRMSEAITQIFSLYRYQILVKYA